MALHLIPDDDAAHNLRPDCRCRPVEVQQHGRVALQHHTLDPAEFSEPAENLNGRAGESTPDAQT